jgi:6-pyruvoyltetrahydropterin/6-carboxytetrahydropterin synthase
MRCRITKSFTFAAAHWLPNVPPGHKCGRLHGHSYEVVLGLEGELDPVFGWVQDFGDVKAAVRPLRERFDHVCLNDVPGLENPTAEHLAIYVYSQLASALPLLTDVTVRENRTSEAVYRP